MNKKRKRYKIEIDQNLSSSTGVDKTSLVLQPAIEINFLAFSKQEPLKMAFQASPDKRMLTGPFMVPDLVIPRYDEEMGEYEVVFSQETIELAMKKFFRNSSPLAINHEHTDQMIQAFVVETWLVEDPENDKANALGFNVPKGTWMGTVFVEDESYWQEYVKTGKVKGFSVEGMMKLALSQIQTNAKQMKKNSFNSADLKKIAFAQHDIAGSDFKLEVEGDLVEGSSVALVDAEGNYFDVPDGEVYLVDGTGVYVQAGKIVKVETPAEDTTPETTSTEMAEATDVTAAIEALRTEIMTAITELSDRIAALEAAPAATEEAMSSVKAELSKVAETVARFSKAPATTPAKKEAEVTPTQKTSPLSNGQFSKPKLSVSQLVSKVRE